MCISFLPRPFHASVAAGVLTEWASSGRPGAPPPCWLLLVTRGGVGGGEQMHLLGGVTGKCLESPKAVAELIADSDSVSDQLCR